MYREILTWLEEWKENKNRKMLFMAGARGVGKTWTLNDFGMGFYDNTAYFDLNTQEYVRFIFEGELEKSRIIKMLSVTCGENIEPEKTFVILENIDSIPNYIDIIDFLSKELKEYHICFTTMKNELSIIENNAFLNDAVDFVTLYPLSFSEFLRVNGEDDLCTLIEENSKKKIDQTYLLRIKQYLKTYMLIGGMPSVVKTYVETDSLSEAETEKSNIIFSYINDFENLENKAFSSKVKQVWESIPKQLAQENKKFQYGSVKITARAREYQDAVKYLIEEKYVTPLYKVATPKAPLEAGRDKKSFELFLTDIGLLSSMYGLTMDDFEESDILKRFEGALAVQYVFEELLHNPNVSKIYYWTSSATAKIDFIFEDGDNIIPIEINLEENTKAQSLKVYKERYKNNMSVRITTDTMSISNGILNLPLFSIWNM